MKTNILFQIGLLIALCITLVGFEYATVDQKTKRVTTNKSKSIEIEVIYDDVKIEKPKVPNLPKNNTQNNNVSNNNTEINNTNIETTNNQNLVNENANINNDSDSVTIVDFDTTDTIVDDSFFDIVEYMPTYEKFLDIKDKEEREAATEKEMISIIYKNIKYPEMSKSIEMQGRIYVEFFVNKEGDIVDITIAKGLNYEMDNEVIKAIKTLPKMVPGKQRDVPVMVRFRVPVEFKIIK